MSTGYFIVSVCMTCGKVYDRKECLPHQDGQESHGYCPVHAARALEEALAEMPTPITPLGWLMLAAVAGICGLPAAQIHAHYRPKAWVAGNDFGEIPAAGMCYRIPSLPGLVGELATRGQVEAAGRLLAWLTPESGSAAAPHAPEPVTPATPRGGDRGPWYQEGAMA